MSITVHYLLVKSPHICEWQSKACGALYSHSPREPFGQRGSRFECSIKVHPLWKWMQWAEQVIYMLSLWEGMFGAHYCPAMEKTRFSWCACCKLGNRSEVDWREAWWTQIEQSRIFVHSWCVNQSGTGCACDAGCLFQTECFQSKTLYRLIFLDAAAQQYSYTGSWINKSSCLKRSTRCQAHA